MLLWIAIAMCGGGVFGLGCRRWLPHILEPFSKLIATDRQILGLMVSLMMGAFEFESSCCMHDCCRACEAGKGGVEGWLHSVVRFWRWGKLLASAIQLFPYGK